MNTQPTTQYLEHDGGKIAYDDQGQGKLIVCVPAGGDTRAEYRFLTPILVNAGYRVVTMDIRGQGETSVKWADYGYEAMAGDIIALIEHLNAGPAVVMGTSKSAGCAVIAANERPELVTKVIMAGPFARTKSKVMAVLTAQIALSPMWGVPLFAGIYNSKMYPIKPADYAEQTAKMRAMLKEPGRLRALRIMFSDSGSTLDGHLDKLQQPTLIIMGEKDPDFPKPAEEVNQLVKRLHSVKAQTYIAPGAGHHPQTQLPQEVGAKVLDFLQA